MAILKSNLIEGILRRGELGDHNDGDGLRLRVRAPSARRRETSCSAVWLLSLRQGCQRRTLKLGDWPGVDLYTAREVAERMREAVAAGRDPGSVLAASAVAEPGKKPGKKPAKGRASGRGAKASSGPGVLATLSPESTFTEVTRACHANLAPSLKGGIDGKYGKLWLASLRPALEAFGDRRIVEVTAQDVEGVLRPIWSEKHVTAKRLAQRIDQVMRFALGARALPPDRPSPVTAARAVMPRHRHREQHFEALPVADVPAFWRDLEGREAMAARCLQWIILTASRSQEARGARWSEIDEAARVWTIPGERIKTVGIDSQTVHLTDAHLAIIDRVRGVHPDLVFPAQSGGVQSVNVFRALSARLGRDGLTAHGFGSTYRSFCEQYTDADPSIIEMSYGHVSGSRVERAYRREAVRARKLRSLAETWSRYVTGQATLAELEAELDG